jgi:hypothetical protein
MDNALTDSLSIHNKFGRSLSANVNVFLNMLYYEPISCVLNQICTFHVPCLHIMEVEGSSEELLFY